MTEPTQPAGPAALTGKRIRLGRLIDPASGSCRIVALDHGMTSPQFLEGLTDTAAKVPGVGKRRGERADAGPGHRG